MFGTDLLVKSGWHGFTFGGGALANQKRPGSCGKTEKKWLHT